MKRIGAKKEKWIIRGYLAGMPARLIAAHLQISIKTVYKKIRKYKKVGDKIFEIKPIGRKKEEINGNFKNRVKEELRVSMRHCKRKI